MFKKLQIFLTLVKIEHSIFALPYAYAGAFLAEQKIPSFAKLSWITVAMVCARTAGMSFNRLIDRFIDARNPRTQQRLLPTGQISPLVVKILIGVSLAGLVLSAAQLNFLCLVLSPLAIVLLWSYSYFKRFSASTHLFLGLVEACAPIGGWLAVSGRWAGEPFLLGLAIIFWIAGFDIIYSLLDYDFDRHNHLFSFAVKFGPQQALNYSFLFHLLTFFFLFMFALVLELSWIFKLGVILIGLLLVVEQYLARQQKVSQAFFTMNCLISLILFSFTLAEVVLRR